MKKLLAVSFAASLVLGACAEEPVEEETTEELPAEGEVAEETPVEEEVTEEEPAAEAPAEAAEDTSSEVISFYLDIAQTINGVDADLNAFETVAADPEIPAEEVEALREPAIASAEEAATAVAAIEVPETIPAAEQESFEEALTAIEEAYTMKAEAIAAGETTFEEANARFAEADEILNGILEENGFAASSLFNEVSA